MTVVAIWRRLCQLARAQRNLPFLLDVHDHWFEFRTMMRAITEWLILTESTLAVQIRPGFQFFSERFCSGIFRFLIVFVEFAMFLLFFSSNWWTNVREMRARVRKKHVQPNDGLSMAQRILMRRKGQNPHKITPRVSSKELSGEDWGFIYIIATVVDLWMGGVNS